MTATRRGGSRTRLAMTGLTVVVALVVLAYGGASWFIYDSLSSATGGCWPQDAANTPDRYVIPSPFPQDRVADYQLPAAQTVTFPSRDPAMAGVTLSGWWIPADPAHVAAAPAVVMVHGIKSCRRESSVLLAAAMLHRGGFSVLAMDLRDHGDSGGDDRRFAGGSEEYLDVLGGWDWVRSQGIAPAQIGLAGMSFGAISALVAGSREAAVPAVWSDSAATRMDTAIGLFVASQVGDTTGLTRLLTPGTVLWARILAGDDLVRFHPVDAVTAYSGRALAFTHGADDAVLPASMAQELASAATASGAVVTQPWIVDNAGHTQGIYRAPTDYETRIVAFFRTALMTP